MLSDLVIGIWLAHTRQMATAFSLDGLMNAAPLDRARQVAAGLPVSAVRELVSDSAMTVADVARIVAPRRTLDRRLKSGQDLTPEEGGRLVRLARVLALTTRVWGTREKAMAWLERPKVRFDGQSPMELLQTEDGAAAVEEVLWQGIHGYTA